MFWKFVLPATLFGLALLLRSFGLNYEASFDELWFLELSASHGSEHTTLPRNQLIAAAPALTSLTTAPSIWKIPATLEQVSHPPLYPMALRLWREAVGSSLVAARWFSVIVSSLCVILLFDSVRVLHDGRAAFFAALLLAVSATQIEVSQEIRNYPLAECCLLFALNSLVRIEAFGLSKVRLALLMIFATATLFTHYFAVPAVASLGLYALLRFRGRKRLAVAGVMVGSALLLGLYLPMMIAQHRANVAQLVYWPAKPQDLSTKFHLLLLSPLRLLFEAPARSQNLALGAGILLMTLPWLCLRRRPKLLLWVLVMQSVLLSIFACDVLNDSDQMLEVRHEVIAAIGLCAVLPALSEVLSGWQRAALPALIAIACLPSIRLRHEPNFEHFTGLAKLAADSRYRDEPIIFFGSASYLWWSDVMFLGVSTYSGTFPRPAVRIDRPLNAPLLNELRRWPGAVLVFEPGNSPEKIVGPATFQVIGTEPFLATVTHVQWDRPTTVPATESLGHV